MTTHRLFEDLDAPRVVTSNGTPAGPAPVLRDGGRFGGGTLAPDQDDPDEYAWPVDVTDLAADEPR